MAEGGSDASDSECNRDAVMQRYVNQARASRRNALSLRKRPLQQSSAQLRGQKCAAAAAATTMPMEMQIQVTVSRSEMKKGKRKVDRKFEPVRINIHRQASFNRVFTKCLIAAWGESREEASYILTDTGGMKIPEELVIDRADCTDHTLPWTLEPYLQVTKMTYHSRPKFQVLKRPLTSQEVDSFPPTQQQVMSDPSADADAGPSSLQQADLVESF